MCWLSFITCAHLELQHLQPLVCELKESQRCLHDIQGVYHVASHVGSAQVTGWHSAQLQEGIQDARQHLAEKRKIDTTVESLNSDEDIKKYIKRGTCCYLLLHKSLPEQSQPDEHPKEPLMNHGRPAPPWGGRGSVWESRLVPSLQVEAPPAQQQR